MLLPMPMNMAIFKILILLNIFLVFPKASSAQELPALSTQVNILTINEFQGLLERSKRWGEFGDQDEAGAVNLITPAKRVLAAKEVREGVAINLSNPMSKLESGDFIVPLEHKTFVFPPLAGPTSPETAAGDVFTINYHGALHSHMDGLAHFGWDGKLYNGFPFEPKPQGFVNVGLEHIASTGIFTRGLLVDMPDLYGLKTLEPGTVITVDHLEAWEKAGQMARAPDARGAGFAVVGRLWRGRGQGQGATKYNFKGAQNLQCRHWTRRRNSRASARQHRRRLPALLCARGESRGRLQGAPRRRLHPDILPLWAARRAECWKSCKNRWVVDRSM